jgi:hypothetical protein
MANLLKKHNVEAPSVLAPETCQRSDMTIGHARSIA